MLRQRFLSLSVWQSPSGRSRRWVRRKDTNIPAPLYARLTILALVVALVATLAWYGVRSLVHRGGRAEAASVAEAAVQARPLSESAAWQRDALGSIESGIHEAQGGNISAAEVAMDRAASVIEAARIASRNAPSDFFETASRSLDRALQAHTENNRLFEHVTAARIGLAQLRSSELAATAPKPDPASTSGNPATSSSLETAAASKDPSGPEAALPGVGKEISIASPREIAANHLLDPSTLGGDTIDATMMPETMEILLPPSSRLFIDNVRVQNLTLKAASQTLDGIHWKNVTFVGTRLRYESGELDLQNVHFVGCTFGVQVDQRGARLANAIALGQTSLTIVE
jgi:hypothetical protein